MAEKKGSRMEDLIYDQPGKNNILRAEYVKHEKKQRKIKTTTLIIFDTK